MEGKDDLDQLGFGGTAMPRYDLNLAGSAGVPTPDQLVQLSLWNGPILPDYKEPDFSTPTLKDGDLAGAGINYVSAFAPDPSLPDLRTTPQPFSVDMPDGMQVQPEIAQDIPNEAEIERNLDRGTGFSGLTVRRDVREPDPPVPDLQQPELKQQSTMAPDERPGDLDPDALDVMHASTQYKEIRDKRYPDVQMDQHGMNNHRSRQFTHLMKGLEEEE